MSEPIKWGQLSPKERNRFLHEQVMGKPVFCSEELDEFPTDPCPVCHATFGIIERLKYDSKTPHPRGDIPAYTTSMDAVWQVVEHFRQQVAATKYRDKEIVARYVKFIRGFAQWGLFQYARRKAADLLCRLALDAYNIQVDWSSVEEEKIEQ